VAVGQRRNQKKFAIHPRAIRISEKTCTVKYTVPNLRQFVPILCQYHQAFVFIKERGKRIGELANCQFFEISIRFSNGFFGNSPIPWLQSPSSLTFKTNWQGIVWYV